MIEWIKRRKWWLFALILVGALVAYLQRWRGSRERSQDQVILAASARYGVPAALIKAVVWRESWFDPSATGRSGEVGLMQIMKDTGSDWAAAEHARWFLHRQLYDPEKNIQCGTWYLRRLLSRYEHTDSPVTYALAAYNAGPGNVAKWTSGAAATNSSAFLRRMAFPGTRDYVVSVTRRYEHYRRTFPPK